MHASSPAQQIHRCFNTVSAPAGLLACWRGLCLGDALLTVAVLTVALLKRMPRQVHEEEGHRWWAQRSVFYGSVINFPTTASSYALTLRS